jgi:transcriptional regulator with GAF, ATPase, and Fis domain
MGETGTGKELIAREIHRLSPRKDALLVTVNCAALPAGLVESELFGHEKGSFTGAMQKRVGRFELANGGTVFLDEIGELPLPAQATLLRVLQEQTLERVGGSQAIGVNVRVIAATNRDLQDEVRKGRFREDLLFRLNVFPLPVPPLRERVEDIPLLARHFVQVFARRTNRHVTSIHPDALRALRSYRWPGNVRELANVIERAMIVCEGSVLEVSHLALVEAPRSGDTEVVRFDDVARRHVLQTLEECGGVIEGPEGAAAKLGLKPATLRSRLKKLGISRTRAGFTPAPPPEP